MSYLAMQYVPVNLPKYHCLLLRLRLLCLGRFRGFLSITPDHDHAQEAAHDRTA